MKLSKSSLLLIGLVGGTAILIAILALARPVVEKKQVAVPLRVIRVMTIEKQPAQMIVRSQGTVTPGTESNLVSQVAGRILSTSSSFEAGGFFNKGDILISIDRSDYEFAVIQAKSQVAQAELFLHQEIELAAIAREEWTQLNSGQIGELAAREPQLKQAGAALDAAKAALQHSQLDLARTSIRAPYTGRIRETRADVGQFISPGTPLGSLYSVDIAEVRLPIPDAELAYINLPNSFLNARANALGPEVILHGSFAGQLREWKGYISRIEGEIDARSRMVYLVARIEDPYRLKKADSTPLLAGMFVEAEILGNSIQDVAIIPRSAVRNGNQTLIVDQDSRLRFREVTILRETGEQAYISAGLSNNERICISPLNIVTDGMPVRVVDDAAPEAAMTDNSRNMEEAL